MSIHARPIFIVDDDPSFIAVLEDTLRYLGFHAVPVLKAREVVPRALAERPSVILLDLTLDEGDGYDVAKAIREEPELSSTPILFLSGRDRWMDTEYARRFGADDYVSKPVTRASLLKKMHAVIAARSFLAPRKRAAAKDGAVI